MAHIRPGLASVLDGSRSRAGSGLFRRSLGVTGFGIHSSTDCGGLFKKLAKGRRRGFFYADLANGGPIFE